jgi:hypothetical protein
VAAQPPKRANVQIYLTCAHCSIGLGLGSDFDLVFLLLSWHVPVVGHEHKGGQPEGTADAEAAETAAASNVAVTLPSTDGL